MVGCVVVEVEVEDLEGAFFEAISALRIEAKASIFPAVALVVVGVVSCSMLDVGMR